MFSRASCEDLEFVGYYRTILLHNTDLAVSNMREF